jgi:hypothetical protein
VRSSANIAHAVGPALPANDTEADYTHNNSITCDARTKPQLARSGHLLKYKRQLSAINAAEQLVLRWSLLRSCCTFSGKAAADKIR